VTSAPEWFNAASFSDADMMTTALPPGFRPWTDDYSNILQILRLK
jgi:hypothetical protein